MFHLSRKAEFMDISVRQQAYDILPIEDVPGDIYGLSNHLEGNVYPAG